MPSNQTLGTRSNPVQGREPMKLARSIILDCYSSGNNRTLAYMNGVWWTWCAYRWSTLTDEQVEHEVFLWLEDAYFCKSHANGNIVTCRIAPDSNVVRDVVKALRAACSVPWLRTPCWSTDSDSRPDADHCVAFSDTVVHVSPAGLTLTPRDETWFSPSVIPCDYNPEALCPRWDQALLEWSGSDPEWISLLQRWFGYCLLGTRRHAKWLLLEGATRGGKSTICRVLAHLVGRPGFTSLSLDDLTDRFGLDGLPASTVINITEATDLERLASHRAARIIKCILGEDPVSINAKYVRQTRNVFIRASIMMTANAIPSLPNDGSGLSSKMLVLPFRTSFDGVIGRPAPQLNLLETLISETPGIAAWALRGAQALISEPDPTKHWPHPQGVDEVREQFAVRDNPVAAFVRARFRQDPAAYVPNFLVWSEWVSWQKATGTRMDIPKHMLAFLLKEKSGWALEPSRRGPGGPHIIRGFSLLKETDDRV